MGNAGRVFRVSIQFVFFSGLGKIIMLRNGIGKKGDFPTRNINNLVNASPNRGVEFLTNLHIL
jgi:hypothetical protein